MPGSSGRPTDEGNTARGGSSPGIPALRACHCRCRRRARPHEECEKVRGTLFFLFFFFFLLFAACSSKRRACFIASAASSCTRLLRSSLSRTVGKAEAADAHELECGGSSDPECGGTVAFFDPGEKCEKPHSQAQPNHHKHELDREKKRMNFVLEENLEGLHREYRRSAPQSAQKCVPEREKTPLKPVLGENLEHRAHHHAELERPSSAPQSAATRKRR